MAKSQSKTSVRFRIVLLSPNEGVDFALQAGKGTGYKTAQLQRSTGKDLVFEIEATFRKAADGSADFSGDSVQGPVGERFIYINIGVSAGQLSSPWSRRLKVPLRGLDLKTLEESMLQAKSFLEARVPGVGRDGGPNCATVKPFDGWKLIK